MKFICTFNDNMKNIDTALLRKGRLISKYEFKPLDIKKGNAILAKLGIEAELTKPLALSDIFNFLEDGYENEQKKSII
jgi:ATP-dependent 26S proteasome regulatory subunit